MSIDMGQLEKSKMYFELAIQYYPESANVYDSMADYYEIQNKISKAIFFMAKTYEMSNSDHYKQKIEKVKEKTQQY